MSIVVAPLKLDTATFAPILAPRDHSLYLYSLYMYSLYLYSLYILYSLNDYSLPNLNPSSDFNCSYVKMFINAIV